jgi:hypothetical protein
MELQWPELAVLPLKLVIQSLWLRLRLLIFALPEPLRLFPEPVLGLGLALDYTVELLPVLVRRIKRIYVIHSMPVNNVLAKEEQWFL